MESSSPSFPDRAGISLVDPRCDDHVLAGRLADAGPLILDALVDRTRLSGVDFSRHMPSPPLVAVLSAGTALRGHVTSGLVRWALGHGVLDRDTRDNMATVLQEALVNATVHGSCGLAGMSGFVDQDDFFRRVSQRLGEEEVAAGMPVIVSIRRRRGFTALHVDDFGLGHQHLPLPRLDDTARSGRGFALMRGFSSFLHVSRGGCRLSTGFSHA